MKHYDNFGEFAAAKKNLSADRVFIPQSMAARELSVVPQTIVNRIKAGTLEGFRLDGKLFVYADSLLELLAHESDQIDICEAYIIQALENKRTHIPYSELMEIIGLSWQNPQHRTRIAVILALVSRKSAEKNKVMISCIVQRKNTKTTGPGFFDLAEALVDEGYIKDYDDEEKFLKKQIKKSLKKYAKEMPS